MKTLLWGIVIWLIILTLGTLIAYGITTYKILSIMGD